MMNAGDSNVIESDGEPSSDPIVAAYEMPRLKGFEEQDALVKKLQSEGELLGSKVRQMPEKMVFDPARGIGMPTQPQFQKEG